MRAAAVVLLALLAAAPAAAGPFRPGEQPASPRLGAALPAGTTAYSNESLADLFVTLTHEFEWGGRRPHLVRYEVPVSVALEGSGAARYAGFVDRYLAGLRARTGIPISRGPAPHNLRIRFVPGRAFRKRMPRQSCFVAPGDPDWDRIRHNPRRWGTRAFERQEAIEAMTVFIPDTAEPYLVRACMIEEIAQALGPADDLYGLGPSIFNDDAAHVWPTQLDYLMLRVLYAPDLHTGLDRRETRARALAVLDRLNPQGRAAPPLPRLRTREMADWAKTTADAFDRSRSHRRRLKSAREALAMAARRAPGSAYHCRSLGALARVTEDRAEALRALDEALRVCAAAHGAGDIRLARLRLERARLLYLVGRPSDAWGESEGLEAIFAAYGQEERLTALYDLQAAVLLTMRQTAHGAQASRRAGAWGAFALGRDNAELRRWTAR